MWWPSITVSTMRHFSAIRRPWPADIRQKLELEPEDALRLLYVSHYNYYRNFETLLRALPRVARAAGRPETQTLSHLPAAFGRQSWKLSRPGGCGPGRSNSGSRTSWWSWVRSRIPCCTSVYRECNMYVAPAYAESFAHPLVEAMASGLPVVAADSAVHREICQDAALYFPRFSPEALARTSLPDCRFRGTARRRSRTVDGRGRAPSPGTNMSMSCWIWRRIFLLQLIPFGEEVAGHRDFPG